MDQHSVEFEEDTLLVGNLSHGVMLHGSARWHGGWKYREEFHGLDSVDRARPGDKSWAILVTECVSVGGPAVFWSEVGFPRLSTRRENELMLRVQAGDLQAFEMLVEHYQNIVYGLALSVLRKPEDAEEAAQDAFLKLFRARDQWDSTRDVEPWLLRIAGNACRDRRRRRQATALPQALGDDELDPLAQIPDHHQAPQVEHEDVRQTVRRELAQLSDKVRLPLELKFLRGLNHEQIASVLGVSVSNVKIQIARAKDVLQSRLRRVVDL